MTRSLDVDVLRASLARASRVPRIALCGPSRCGKDTAAEWLVAHTNLRYWGPTSRVIAPVAAERLGLAEEEAYARRHEDRVLWRDLGREIRREDPAALVRKVLTGGEIVVGVRDRIEMTTAREEGLFDLAIWVDRPGLPTDPTLEYGPELCDVILPNRWGLAEFRDRVLRLAGALGVLRRA